MASDTRDWLTATVAGIVGVSPDRVIDDARLADDLGFDEVDSMELVMEAESEFRITIHDGEVSELRTVRDAILLIDRKRPTAVDSVAL